MHNLQTRAKAFLLCLAFVLPATLGLASAQQLNTKTVNNKAAAKQELKKKIKKANKKQAETAKPAEEVKTPESKKVVTTPTPPPAPVTPDKKKYASPNGNQVMTDGTVVNFRSMGVINMNGYRYTYYSSKVLYHHKTPEWYACDDHLYRTADGYIVVASKNHALGSIVPTPFGKGKVMDYCHVGGTIDIYVDF